MRGSANTQPRGEKENMNQVRYITLRYEDSIKGFSEDAILSATFGRTVVDRKEYFFVQDGVPHLLVSLLLSGQGTGDAVPPRRNRGGEGNPEERLNDENRPVYLALKDWRNRTSKKQGCPAYNIARNWQLVELVLKAPKTLAALKEINGFGESFCKLYGEEVLKMLAEVKPSEAAEKGEEAS